MNLYFHIPFCTGKCHYCAFFSQPYQDVQAERFLDALEHEIATSSERIDHVSTLYIGGGTPSTLSSAQWQRFTNMLQREFDLSTCSEWTIEANPGTISTELAEHWSSAGCTRISLGVQSMHDATLARMGRHHTPRETEESFSLLRQYGFMNIGIDLIAGLPGVSLTEWQHTLDRVISLAPEHASVYAWSLEPGSHLDLLHRSGNGASPNADLIESALERAAEQLIEAGFEHYEISNFSLPGQRCQHNINIWQGEDYLGYGPAAASRVGRQRWINQADIEAYCQTSDHPPRDQEMLSPETDAAERLIFRFRLADAISLNALSPPTPVSRHLQHYWLKQLDELVENGLVKREGNAWRRTDKGARFADAIAEALLPPCEASVTQQF